MAELQVADFLRTRIKEYNSELEVRKGTAFDTLFFKMAQFILQPLMDNANNLFIGGSLRRILQTEDPDSFDEEIVDDLVANIYITRMSGSRAVGTARVYYDIPVAREFPENGLTITGSNGLKYLNSAPFRITTYQMETQFDQGSYYFDIPVIAENEGSDYDLLDAGSLVSVDNDPDALYVTNLSPVRGGLSRETNTQLIERAQQSITVRDLVTGKGSSSILFETFPGIITEMQAIGFGDPEMMRDVMFNAHIGGKHDQYVKTAYISTRDSDFTGALIDTSRSSPTTTQLVISGTYDSDDWYYLGESNIDRTLGDPVVSEVKAYSKAMIVPTAQTVEISGTPVSVFKTTINLIGKEWINVTLDDVSKDVRIAGEDAGKTTRQQIITAINNAFGYKIATVYNDTIKLQSITEGKASYIEITQPEDPLKGNAFPELFVDIPPVAGYGDGPVVFTEDLHYKINAELGKISRVVPPGYIIGGTDPTPSSLLITDNQIQASPLNFQAVHVNDLLTYDGKDYRITAISEDYDIITLDEDIVDPPDPVPPEEYPDMTDLYYIKRTGIKDNELIHVAFYFNPLSVDVGKYVKLDDTGMTRGIRPGREDMTIQDVAFLRVNSISIIDPVSGEPTGDILQAEGGYGMGEYGGGAYGIGSFSDYRLMVNEPTARFSAFEDSYIVINSAYQGYSFRINYDCVPEIEQIHSFCRSDYERVLDGDVLVKHFLPAYVDAVIEYQADSTDSSIPDNDTLTGMVKEFINTRKAGTNLQMSDISQYILRAIDPYARYSGNVKPFKMSAVIHNADATTVMIEDTESLVVPTPDPFPRYTEAPLSGRIVHWVAGNIQMVRL